MNYLTLTNYFFKFVTQNSMQTNHKIFNLRLTNTFNNKSKILQLIYKRSNKLLIEQKNLSNIV